MLCSGVSRELIKACTARYARVANKPYDLRAANHTDFETHFTVVRYDDDPAVASSQVSRPAGLTEASRLS